VPRAGHSSTPRLLQLVFPGGALLETDSFSLPEGGLFVTENERKLVRAFVQSLQIPEERVGPDLVYGTSQWDSVAHMTLIAAIESEFDILIDTDDVIDLSGYEKSKEIVSKYGVNF
jgi:acyl carrier protein